MTYSIKDVAFTCLNQALSDEAWQDLGFKKRPKYGSLFQLLRPSWKVFLEKNILQELVCAFSASYIIADITQEESIEQLASLYAEDASTAQALGFSSYEDALSFFTRRINTYIQTSPNGWPSLMISRLQPKQLPSKKLAGRLYIGCYLFGQSLADMILLLKRNRKKLD